MTAVYTAAMQWPEVGARRARLCDYVQPLGEQIARQRYALDLSQTEVARRTGLTRQAITDLENGNGCTVRTLALVAEALGLKVTLSEGG